MENTTANHYANDIMLLLFWWKKNIISVEFDSFVLLKAI